jgi:O-antigen/teichoic acid export membrane protein
MRRADVLASTVVRTPISTGRLRRQLLEHVRIPLHRDGYALALNSAFTAATGLLYWILAAKTYSPRSVGLNSALISTMMFLAGIASLNLPNIIVRFLPESGDRTRLRVTWAYIASGALALCAAAGFIVGVGSWAPRLGFLRSDHGLQAWFLFSTLAWCLFVIQDSVLTALGRAIWVPVENAVFSLLKLALLAALATMLPLYGIFVSWTIAMLVSVVGVNVFIFARLMRPAAGHRKRAVLSVRDGAFARYFAADYVCSVAWLSTTNLMPVIVTAAAGATTNAYWAIAYALAIPLYAVAQNFGTSLMLHGTADRAALPALARKAALQGSRVLVPSVVLLVVLAPYLLSPFGEHYAERSATVLRLLALGALPNFVVVLAVHIARVQRRLRRAVIALSTEAVIALGLATPLLHALGVVGVGIAWVCAQSLVALGLLLTWRSWFQADAVGTGEPPRVPVSEFAAAAAPTSTQANAPADGAGGLHPVLRRLFAALECRQLRWALLRVPSNPAAPSGDIDVLVAPADADALRDVAAELGFVALPGWGSTPDLILICYDRPTDCWLVLDVSTAVAFRADFATEATDQRDGGGCGRGRVLAAAAALPAGQTRCCLSPPRAAAPLRLRRSGVAAGT